MKKLSLVLAFTLAACGKDSTAPVDVPVTARWYLMSVDGKALPVKVKGVPDTYGLLWSAYIELKPEGVAETFSFYHLEGSAPGFQLTPTLKWTSGGNAITVGTATGTVEAGAQAMTLKNEAGESFRYHR